MKTRIFIFLFLLSSLNIFSQTDKFIEVIGSSELEIKSESVRIFIQLSEIKRDEYQKIREQSVEEELIELNTYLKTIGYSKEDLIEIWPTQNNYNNKEKIQQFYLFLKNKEEAKAISNFPIKGFKVSKFSYYYPQEIKIDYKDLSIQAIESARKKAEHLAKSVNKKIGRIINISDLSKRKITPSSFSNKISVIINYTLTIKYELLD